MTQKVMPSIKNLRKSVRFDDSIADRHLRNLRAISQNMKSFYTISLLILSNIFMTLAWYGHLQFKNFTSLKSLGLFAIILISWGLAFFEYIFQVPANKIGYKENGGPFSMFELKTIQEAISLIVFTLITTFIFKTEKLAWNHLVGFLLIVLAVFVIFKKW
jgi:uncharacterized protein